MKIAVCEDEKLFQKKLVLFLERYYHSLEVLIDTFESGEELIKKYDKKNTYDLLFLDIEMKELDGIATAKKLRAYGGNEFIVFLTSHTELAMEGYEVEAIRFLAKPLKESKLIETLCEIERRMKECETFVLHTQKEDIIVEVQEIVYIESVRNDAYVFVCNRGEQESENKMPLSEYRVRKKLADLELELSGNLFFRCHRSYMVNLDFVTSYNRNQMVLLNGITIPVSRGREKKLKEKILNRLRK